MRERCFAVLDAAWASGIRYFDAARSYGRAEEFLSAWLAARGIAPADVVVGSKWGYRYTADWQVAPLLLANGRLSRTAREPFPCTHVLHIAATGSGYIGRKLLLRVSESHIVVHPALQARSSSSPRSTGSARA